MAITRVVHKNVPKYQTDPETGEVDRSKTPVLVEEEEVKATGKDVEALTPVFEKSSWVKQNQLAARKKKYGVTKITDPQGNVQEVFGHQEAELRKLGWGQKALKTYFNVKFGESRENPTKIFRRTKYKFIDGKFVETFREER